MGAWSVSVFGNDDAADFSAEFEGADSVDDVAPILEAALCTVLDSSPEIDAPDGAVGLAAAALVVAWNEPAVLGDDASYAPQPWPRNTETLPALLAAQAAAVLDRMKSADGNELAGLWDESGEGSAYLSEIARWRSRLP